MWMLRVAVTCLALSLMALLFVPFGIAKVMAGVFAFLFVVFLVLGLTTVDNLNDVSRRRRRAA